MKSIPPVKNKSDCRTEIYKSYRKFENVSDIYTMEIYLR